MDEVGRARLKVALGRYYAAHREAAAPEVLDELTVLMVKEDSRVRKALNPTLSDAAFVAAQVRFVPAWVWAAQLIIVAIMVWIAFVGGDIPPVRGAVALMSTASVLVCVPTLSAGKQHHVVELEYACRNGCTRVLVARLIILGCSCALAIALMVVGTSIATGLGALSVTLWACPPYFLSCAGALAALRRAREKDAAAASITWVFLVCAAVLTTSSAFPMMYEEIALIMWVLAAVAAFAWLVFEGFLVIRAAAAGLDSFAPHNAAIYE